MTDRLQADDIVDSRYKIVSRLGSGGMADVYCAEDQQLGRNVALKLLYRRFAEDSEFVERFRREASSAAGLQHPNVVAVYDRGEVDGTQYIAMEYVEGRSLKDIVRADGALPAARAIALTEQILRAARFAHKRGIVHRDLKPHNVIVDSDDRAKVTDFGIARAGASDMTQTGSIMGTAQYLSPEQAQGLPVSQQSDLYSIGIVLYELLTGRVPFDGESAVAIALQQVGAEPIPPSQLNPAVPPALDHVVLHALQKDPADRPADADEFLAELEAAGAGLETGTEQATSVLPALGAVAPLDPPTGSYEFAEYGLPTDAPAAGEEDRRNRWWIALLVGLGVAALVIGGLLLFGARKVTVPQVTGSAQAVAEATLADKGFSTDSKIKTSTLPKGQVIAQDPPAGARVKKGSTVTLTVSGGPGQARIPELGGAGRGAARKQLEALGFNVIPRVQTDPDVPKNHVISTDPGAGQTIDKGSTVVLVISSGPEQVTVPSLVGKSRDDAQTALDDAGLVASFTEKEDDKKDPGTVLSQDPADGTKVAKGSKVKLTIAKAPTTFPVPDMTGKSADDAVSTLSGDGFKVVTVTKKVTDPGQDSIVLKQDPSTGKLEKGKTVTITVGRYTAPTDTTTTVPDTTTTTTPEQP